MWPLMGLGVYDSNNGGIFAKEFTPTNDGIEVMWATHVLGMCSKSRRNFSERMCPDDVS